MFRLQVLPRGGFSDPEGERSCRFCGATSLAGDSWPRTMKMRVVR